MKRRSFIAAGFVCALPTIWSGLADARLFNRGIGVANSGTAVNLATVTVVNTSGSTQAANVVSPIFGWCFKKGDVASGTAPTFQVSGLPQPYSWGCQSYWADGSLRFAAFMLRATFSLAGSASQAVQVWNNGTAPVTSSRALTEVYTQSLKVVGVSQGASFGLAAGTWTANLSNDAFNHEQFVYLDGDAGKVWRIRTDFVQSGAAHGQLVCYHYVAALTANGGGLGGFRYLPRVTQPWYNVDSPAKNWRAFSSLKWQYGAGPTQTNFTWPFGASSVSWNSGFGLVVFSGATYWDGSASGPNNIPAVFSGLSAGSGLSTTQLYFIALDHAASNAGGIHIYTTPNGDGPVSVATNMTGTCTPVMTCLHFGNIYGATASGKWSALQGTGGGGVEGTCRTQYDTAYWHTTKMIPPWTLNATDAAGFAGQTIDANWGAYNWNPQSLGFGLSVDQDAAGDHDGIAPFSQTSSMHFYAQTAQAEIAIRCQAFGFSHLGYSFRASSTGTLVNLGDPGVTYTGLPTSLASTLYWDPNDRAAGNLNGAGVPTMGSAFISQTQKQAHQPEFCAYTYMVTGEPQFLDMLQENAIANLLVSGPGARNKTTPITVYGGAFDGDSQQRSVGWAGRTWGTAAGLSPATSPDGSAIGTLIKNTLANYTAYMLSMMDNSVLGSYAATYGWYSPASAPASPERVAPGGYWRPNATQTFEYGYVGYGLCVAAAMAEDAGAITFLTNCLSVWFEHIASAVSPWNIYSHGDRGTLFQVSGGSVSPDYGPLVTSDSSIGETPGIISTMWMGNTGGSVYTTVSRRASAPWFSAQTAADVHWNGDAGNTNVHDGDIVAWNDAFPLGDANLPDRVAYYVRDQSGANFNLATSPTGTAIVPAGGAGAIPFPTFGIPKNPGTGSTFNNGNQGGSHVLSMYGLSRYVHAVLGGTKMSSIVTDSATRLSAIGGVPYATYISATYQNPKFVMQDTF